jgi:hypothetical protein
MDSTSIRKDQVLAEPLLDKGVLNTRSLLPTDLNEENPYRQGLGKSQPQRPWSGIVSAFGGFGIILPASAKPAASQCWLRSGAPHLPSEPWLAERRLRSPGWRARGDVRGRQCDAVRAGEPPRRNAWKTGVHRRHRATVVDESRDVAPRRQQRLQVGGRRGRRAGPPASAASIAAARGRSPPSTARNEPGSFMESRTGSRSRVMHLLNSNQWNTERASPGRH